jgi:hypothetical protein
MMYGASTIAEMDIPVLRSQDEWVKGAVPPQLKEPQEALKWGIGVSLDEFVTLIVRRVHR